jgi:hypothetical protein
MRERGSLAILVDELGAQSAALADLIARAERIDFAVGIFGVMRQLRELRFLIDIAHAQAAVLTAPDQQVEERANG